MLRLIILLVFGSVMAYLSLENTLAVPVTLFGYTFPHVPLFFVIIGSMLGGILLAYVIHLVQSLFTALILRSKDKKIRDERNELAELTKKYHQLEIENAELKTKKTPSKFESESM